MSSSTGNTPTPELTILTTEHSTLQSARQLCLQDMQSRSTMYLTTVSASLIAIGFFGNATQFRGSFVVFVLALLISLWVLGTLTWVRLVQAAIEDVIICFGLARIRHQYTEIAPEVRDLFVRSIHDDFPGILMEMGSTEGWWQGLMPTYIVVAFVTSVLAGAVVAFSLNEFANAAQTVQLVSAVAAFTLNAVLFRLVALRFWGKIYPTFRAHYPSPL